MPQEPLLKNDTPIHVRLAWDSYESYTKIGSEIDKDAKDLRVSLARDLTQYLMQFSAISATVVAASIALNEALNSFAHVGIFFLIVVAIWSAYKAFFVTEDSIIGTKKAYDDISENLDRVIDAHKHFFYTTRTEDDYKKALEVIRIEEGKIEARQAKNPEHNKPLSKDIQIQAILLFFILGLLFLLLSRMNFQFPN